ncbi:MAG: hypothetical protein AAB466_00225, partial [Verrucomicrobiota bacterium]
MQLLDIKAGLAGSALLCFLTGGFALGQPTINHETSPVYTSGSAFTVTNSFAYSGQLLSLLMRPQLPGGWTVTAVQGNGNPEFLFGEILWTGALPPSPIRMVYTVQVPSGATGAKELR